MILYKLHCSGHTEDKKVKDELVTTGDIRAGILEEARKAVCTDRNEQYGEPEDSFSVIAELWSAYLTARCAPSNSRIDLSAADAAEMLVLFKVARSATAIAPKTDTYADMAGYAACAGELACGGVKHG
jgi:hypothetical protein